MRMGWHLVGCEYMCGLSSTLANLVAATCSKEELVRAGRVCFPAIGAAAIEIADMADFLGLGCKGGNKCSCKDVFI